MDQKLQRQIDALNGDQFNLQPSRIHGIPLLFEGTASTGVTGALADLGSVIVTRGDRQIVNADVEDIAEMMDIRQGSQLFSSTEASTFQAEVFIPFYESSLDDDAFYNALKITGDNELNFEWVPKGDIDTKFDSISVKVFAELAAYAEKYEPYILRDNQNESGSVSGKPYPMNKDNITGLYLKDPDSIIDLIQVEQNERSVVSPQSFLALKATTLRTNRLETSDFDMVRIKTFTEGNRASSVNRDTVVTATTSGGGDIPILKTGIRWPGNRGGNRN